MELVNLTEHEQTGSWQALQIVPLEEIINCPDILTNGNASQVNIVADPNTLDILPVPELFSISVTKKRTSSGFQHSIKIQIDFRYQSTSVDDFLETLQHKKVVVIGVKLYGAEKMFGSKLHPLTFNYSFIDGKRVEDGAKTRVSIIGKTPQKPVFIKD